MSYKYPQIQKNLDKTYGPTRRGSKYLSVDYHNKSAKTKKGKNRWKLKQHEQYEVFRIADDPIWYCNSNNGLFSIVNNGEEILGVLDERLAYFCPPVNPNDPWHGYPVTSAQYMISEELLDVWENGNIITNKVRKKIGKGQF